MGKKRKFTGVALTALLLIVGLIAPATAQASEHCPGANQNAPAVPDGYTIVLDNDTTESYSQEDKNDTVLPAGTQVCVKGGQAGATGIVTADGVKTLQEILGSGQDVSHYMTYTTSTQPDPEAWVCRGDEVIKLVGQSQIDRAIAAGLNPRETEDEAKADCDSDTVDPVIAPRVSFSTECTAEGLTWTLTLDNSASADNDGDATATFGVAGRTFDVAAGETEVISRTIPLDGDALSIEVTFGERSATYTADPADCESGPGPGPITPDTTPVPPVDVPFELNPQRSQPSVSFPTVEVDVLDEEPIEQPTPEPAPIAVEQAAEQAQLPRTGVPALVLALMGLASIGLGGTLLRKRSEG